jgi:hypothetical protein
LPVILETWGFMADDDVGVDPDRLAESASALENLRNVLAANVPVIVNTMEGYWSGGAGAPVNLLSLRQAEARSVQDAADMRARSNLAAAWMANPANIDLVAGGLAYIPWSGSALDQADAALQAQNLNAAVALAKTDPAAARAMLAAIADDLNDHSSDRAYLTAFWSQPGVNAAVANIASVLRTTSPGTGTSPRGSAVAPLRASGGGPANQSAMSPAITTLRSSTQICSPKARDELGIPLRGGGTRTPVLTDEQLEELGFPENFSEKLTGWAGGRTTTVMIYENQDAIDARGDNITLPDARGILSYYNKQEQIATQDETNEEIQQIEEQEEAEISEDELEAEGEAEAEAMAMEDDE